MSRRRKSRARKSPARASPAAARETKPAAANFPALLAVDQTRWFAPLLTAVFAAALFYAALHHEMWRDELQAWLLARDSTGPLDLLRNMRYEGHPALWPLLLMPLTRLTHNPFAMQMLNLCIVAAAVFLFVKHAPFNPLQKILFAFGFYPLYEWGVFARSYGIGLLAVIMVCIAMQRRAQKPLWLGAALFLLSQVSVHTCILVIAVICGWAVDEILQRRAGNRQTAAPAGQLALAFAVAIAGIALAVLQMNPPPDSAPHDILGWLLHFDADRFHRTLALPKDILFPSPPGSSHFWGAAVIQQSALVCVVLFALVIALHWRRPAAVLICILGVGGLLLFSYMKYFGQLRHHGFILLAFLLMLWGGRSMFEIRRGEGGDAPRTLKLGFIKFNLASVGSYLLTAVLAVQMISGVRAVAADLRHPYSHGKDAAAFIQNEGLDSLPMLAWWDASATSIYGYLPPSVEVHNYMKDNRAKWVRWDFARRQHLHTANVQSFLARADEIAAQSGGEVLLIARQPLAIPPESEGVVQPLAAFDGKVLYADERYFLYLYRG